MIDRFGKVLRDKERQEREMERAELRKTFRFAAQTLLNACSALKAQIVKALKKCLRMD